MIYSEKKMLIIEPCAGLGNRILALATAYHLAQKTGHRLILLWDIDGAVGIPVENIFELPQDIRIIHTSKLPYRSRPLLRLKSEIVRRGYRRRPIEFLDCCDIAEIRKKSPECIVEQYLKEYGRIYIKSFCELEEIQDHRIFGIFKPAPRVIEHGREVFEQLTDKTAGFHIRRTDHEEAIKNSPVELFADKMQELLDSGKAERFFLATDDEQVEKQLLEQFGNAIVCKEGKKFSRDDEQGMLDGVVDMLALSKCSCIYGSFGSTFSRIAAYLGNKKLVILKREEPS